MSAPPGPRSRVDFGLVRELGALGKLTLIEIGAQAGCHPAYVRQILAGRIKPRGERGRWGWLSRTDAASRRVKRPTVLGRLHAAMVGMRSMFASRVFDVGADRLLKSGYMSPKIGKTIVKGRWRGFPVYMLTLEERATCPADCALLASCYGNNMPQAVRWRHGPEIEARLALEVNALAFTHRGRGFAVRLHVLGDFYSVDYVRLWGAMLDVHPELHVFGFTARRSGAVAAELALIQARHLDRFQLRWSGSAGRMGAVTVARAAEAPVGAIVCPQELGKTRCCATCALCWSTERPIAFVLH